MYLGKNFQTFRNGICCFFFYEKSEGFTNPIAVMNKQMVKGEVGFCRSIKSVKLKDSSVTSKNFDGVVRFFCSF
jgi:hypothetical protein